MQQWGLEPWGGPFPTPLDIPFRYALSDVHLHCVTEEMPPVLPGQNPETKAGDWLHYLALNYGINESAEINVFVSKMSAGSGVAFRGGRYTNIGWFEPRLFNHEMGHVLSLLHVFEGNDGCDDTPKIIYDYDANCDGDYNDPGDINDGYCWNHIGGGNPICKRDLPCLNHPCCSWENIDNNVMGDNAIAQAYSACQIEKILDNINSSHCSQIESVTDLCPPPMAIIDIHPLDDLRESYCSYCLRLEASSNDELYKLDIYEITSVGEVLVTSTNWINGPAYSYCISTSNIKPGSTTWFGGFKPNTNYRAVLTVKNNCAAQHMKDLVFTTPETNCNIDAEADISIVPNPVTSDLAIDYSIPSTSYVHIFHSHSIYGRYGWDIEYNTNKPSGSYTLNVNVSGWYSGINYIIFQHNNQVYSTAIVKQ